jgi:hypothetical protein
VSISKKKFAERFLGNKTKKNKSGKMNAKKKNKKKIDEVENVCVGITGDEFSSS